MKIKKNKSKLNKLLRAALCLCIVLSMSFASAAACFAVTVDPNKGFNAGDGSRYERFKQTKEAFASEDPNACEYAWYRVTSQADMNYFFSDAVGDCNYGSNSNWMRIMIAYKSGNTTYFLANPGTGESVFYATQAQPSFGMAVGDPVWDDSNAAYDKYGADFVTRSGLNTLYAKYYRYDSEHGGNEYFLRYSNDTYQRDAYETNPGYCLGSNLVAINMCWYGCKWAAAAEAHPAQAPYNNPGAAAYEWGHSINSTIDVTWTIFFNQYAGAAITFNTHRSNVHDRSMSPSGSTVGLDKDDHYNFYIYVGIKTQGSFITENTTLSQNDYKYITDYTLNCALTVPYGTTLVIDGVCYNNGSIIVEDGGTLVVKGTLDDSGGKITTDAAGTIKLNSGSSLIIEENAALLQRSPDSKIVLSSGSSAYIEGVLLCANELQVQERSSFRAIKGSFVSVGLIPHASSSTDIQNFKPGSLRSSTAYITYYGYANNNNHNPFVSVGENSSLEIYGGSYMLNSNLWGSGGYVYWPHCLTNINASITNAYYLKYSTLDSVN